MSTVCYLINPRGFCFGVNRAINIATQSVKLYKTLYITEDIVHNNRVMQDFAEMGIVKVASVKDIPDAGTYMISAHGAGPDVLQNRKDLTVIDGTCPIVRTIQRMINKAHISGEKIVIIGKRTHAEIIGYIGWAENKDVYVVNNEADVALLPDFQNEQVKCFSQTTLTKDVIDNMTRMLKEKIPHIQVPSHTQGNACDATRERQEAVKSIADKIDLFLVAGSQSSSNARALSTTAISSGAKMSILIDGKTNLNRELFLNASTIAITAGASTPEYVVQEILEYIKENIPDIRVEEVFREEEIKEDENIN